MSDSDNIIIASAAFIIFSQTLKNKRRQRRWWVTNLIQRRIMDNVGEAMTDMQEQEKSGQFHNFCRIESEDFDHFIISDQRSSRFAFSCQESCLRTVFLQCSKVGSHRSLVFW